MATATSVTITHAAGYFDLESSDESVAVPGEGVVRVVGGGTAEIVGWAILRAIRACGLPLGVFSLLQGKGEDVGAPLIRRPEIRDTLLSLDAMDNGTVETYEKDT